mgnify:FL=1
MGISDSHSYNSSVAGLGSPTFMRHLLRTRNAPLPRRVRIVLLVVASDTIPGFTIFDRLTTLTLCNEASRAQLIQTQRSELGTGCSLPAPQNGFQPERQIGCMVLSSIKVFCYVVATHASWRTEDTKH